MATQAQISTMELLSNVSVLMLLSNAYPVPNPQTNIKANGEEVILGFTVAFMVLVFKVMPGKSRFVANVTNFL